MKKKVDEEKLGNQDIKENIADVCKNVVLQNEITKKRDQLQKELATTRQQLVIIRQQAVLMDAKINQLSGGITTCNEILQESQKTKSLALLGDNTKPKEK